MAVGGRATVQSVGADPSHRFSKPPRTGIHLLADWGVEGDAHAGPTVKHRSRVRQDPTQPNLRQVHLIQGELLDELAAQGFQVLPGDLGENVLTRGLDLLGLPRGAQLQLGTEAVVELTGLRNPCAQIEAFAPGLLAAVLGHDEQGQLIRRAGVMGVVRRSGLVQPGDPLRVTLPPPPHLPLERV
ncbi:MOSC domain-containing protein [Deinococcus navajonensis]|uniref:MOSC domain-containing protein n=1 Tax=Deinococcus navajonensis TaxID=309884 RepID=A0ABV8XJR4_9DEIO